MEIYEKQNEMRQQRYSRIIEVWKTTWTWTRFMSSLIVDNGEACFSAGITSIIVAVA